MPEIREVIFSPDVEEKLWGRTRESTPRPIFIALRPLDIDRGIWACITAFVPTDPAYESESEEPS